MGKINAILDEQVSWGFEGGPEYSTGEVDLENGLQVRQGNWRYPRHRYSASFANIQEAERDYLIEVFHACRGKLHTFKFKDWNDFKAENEALIVATGNEAIQLYKVYQFGQAYTVRPVQALKVGSVQITDNSGTIVAGIFDHDTGTFVPAQPWDPAKTYRWTGEFYVWVHFADDYNSMTINGWQNHTANVDLEEDKFRIIATNVPSSWDE